LFADLEELEEFEKPFERDEVMEFLNFEVKNLLQLTSFHLFSMNFKL
jgi:hypothetical protein